MLIPFPVHGEMNTVVGHAKEFLMRRFESDLGTIVLALSFSLVMLTIFSFALRPEWITKSRTLSENILGGPLGLVARFCALPIAVFVVCGEPERFGVFFQYASIIVLQLAPRLVMLTVVLSLTAPLLLDFGFVQFAAVFAGPIMRPLFKLPGRSAVDGVASWLGSSSMAVVITAKMHGHGFYTDREAVVMVTSFSLTGIHNIYALTELMDMTYVFGTILFAVYFCMVFLALLLPRMWPLRAIPDTYLNGIHGKYEESHGHAREGRTLLEKAVLRGIGKARRMSLRKYLRESLAIALPLLFGTIPLMITLGTTLVVLAEFTPLAKLIAAPLSLLLEAVGVVEADVIGSAAVFSFIDQYLAVTYGQAMFTEEARFICICLTAVGLINLTEIGIHVWHSTIPLKFWQMGVLYCMRIVLSLFILVPLAGVLF